MRKPVLLTAFLVIAWMACNAPPQSVPQQPQIRVDRTALQFGTQYGTGTFVGASAMDSLQIFNDGKDDLLISGVNRTDSVAAFTFATPTPLDSRVPGGGSTVLTAYFAPTAGGWVDGGFTIASNTQNSSVLQVDLIGLGLIPALIRAQPAVVDFGRVTVDRAKAGAVQVFNVGQAPLTISSVSLYNDRGAFFLTGTQSATLQPDASVTVSVSFVPADAGIYDGGLVIISNAFNDPAHPVGLIGVAVPDAG